jgi:hypothetical protein
MGPQTRGDVSGVARKTRAVTRNGAPVAGDFSD